MSTFSIIIICIWVSAAIGSIATKNSDSFGAAFSATFVIGLGYFLLLRLG